MQMRHGKPITCPQIPPRFPPVILVLYLSAPACLLNFLLAALPEPNIVPDARPTTRWRTGLRGRILGTKDVSMLKDIERLTKCSRATLFPVRRMGLPV